jgi:hypothetical protein
MIAASNAHGGAATPEVLEDHVVAHYAAESLKFEYTTNASHASSRPEPVASTVAVVDCSRGGEPT